MSRKPALYGGLALLVACLVLIVPGRPFAQDVQDVQQLDLNKPKIATAKPKTVEVMVG